MLDAAVALIRGFVMGIPVWGREVVTERWLAIRPVFLDATAQLLDAERE
jgi:hypothetical protein